MSLLPEHEKLADRGLRAAFADEGVPPDPGHRPQVARAIVELQRALLHTCDRYDLDLYTLSSTATAVYYEDRAANAEFEPPQVVEPGRNLRHDQMRRRAVARQVPVPGRGVRAARKAAAASAAGGPIGAATEATPPSDASAPASSPQEPASLEGDDDADECDG